MRAAAYLELERRLGAWCEDQPDVLAAIVVGSRGRLSPPPDDYSDLDLILLCAEPARYTDDSAWLSEIGELWIAVLQIAGPGDPEWLVLFDGGLKVDILLASAGPDQPLTKLLAAMPYQDVLARGARLLYSRGSRPANWTPATMPPVKTDSPTRQEFEEGVNETLLVAERLARFIQRGDDWRGHDVVNGALKRSLLTLLEWHARFEPGRHHDTWYQGRFIQQWADHRMLEAVKALDAGYDLQELARSFARALRLIDWLAGETAQRLGYHYPTPGQELTLTWLRQSRAIRQ